MRKNRELSELRKVKITRNFNKHAEGSALIEFGNTKVICTASVDEKVPPFLRDKGEGWVTAEYSMIPRSTNTRMVREAAKGKLGGRTYEIQRLIGRSLRAVIDFKALGERTVWIDCDVIQADGGTRTAAITGGFVAMYDAMEGLKKKGLIKEIPLSDFMAAISVGIVNGKPCLDLEYTEDSSADVDMNIVMTGKGRFIEIQGTGEGTTFSGKDMDSMIVLAKKGIKELVALQKKALKV